MRSLNLAVFVLACTYDGLLQAQSQAPSDFAGVWSMVQHDRLGAPLFIPVEPEIMAAGKAATEAFKNRCDVLTYEANAHCVEPGMPSRFSTAVTERIAKTLGPEGTRAFLVKGAGHITPIEQLVLSAWRD